MANYKELSLAVIPTLILMYLFNIQNIEGLFAVLASYPLGFIPTSFIMSLKKKKENIEISDGEYLFAIGFNTTLVSGIAFLILYLLKEFF